MAKLNLNFHQQIGRHEPTKNEIYQIEGIALSVEAIIKALGVYAYYKSEDTDGVCLCVCNTLELLMEPILEYLTNYAGDLPAPEPLPIIEPETAR